MGGGVGAGTGVGRVFGKQLQAFFGRGLVDAAVLGGQGSVHRERASLPRLVLDAGGNSACGVDEFKGREVGDRGQLLEVVGKGHGEQAPGAEHRGQRGAVLCRSACCTVRTAWASSGAIGATLLGWAMQSVLHT